MEESAKVRSTKSKTLAVVYVPPTSIPAKHLIDPSTVNAIARGINLKRPDTWTKYNDLFPKKPSHQKKQLFMTPLHFSASHESWEGTIHSIHYFYHLPLAKQEAEVAKAKSFSTEQKRYLWQNRKRLMESRPPPLLPACPPPRPCQKQLVHLTSLSAERASKGKDIASKIIAAPCGDVFLRGPSITLPTNQLAPVKCGFEATTEMLAQIKSSSSKSYQQQQLMVKKEEIKIKEEPYYNYETDEDDGKTRKVSVTPPSPVRSISESKEKSSLDDKVRVKEEDYEYDTDGSLPRENCNNRVDPGGKGSIDLDKLDVGSRVVVICGKGKRWNATIRKRYQKMNMSGFLLHYDGNKKSSETWVPEHRVVDLISDEVDTESPNNHHQAGIMKKHICLSEGNMHDCAGRKSSGKKRKHDSLVRQVDKQSTDSSEPRKKPEVSPKGIENKFEATAVTTTDRSKKQKEVPRKLIAKAINHLGSTLCESGNWNLKKTSFLSNEIVPLDVVHFNEEKNRYQVEAGTNVNDDDVIIQAMVVFSLYRMEKGWGKGSSWKALSIWSGEPSAESDIFPLTNLWKEEIQDLIAQKKLGKTTLAHYDYFDNFPKFYGTSTRKRWRRRSDTHVGQVHIFAEQAAIQVALHLHRNLSREYSYVASHLIHFALSGDDKIMEPLAVCLLNTARKESDCFPKTAFDDMIALK